MENSKHLFTKSYSFIPEKDGISYKKMKEKGLIIHDGKTLFVCVNEFPYDQVRISLLLVWKTKEANWGEFNDIVLIYRKLGFSFLWNAENHKSQAIEHAHFIKVK